MTVRAVLVVKNEADGLAKCLDSLEPFVSAYTIIDTGSRDRTRQIAARFLKTRNGELHMREWVGYAHNMAEGLEIAHESGNENYLLRSDGDFVWSGSVPEELTADSYLVRMAGPFDWWLPLLVKASIRWEYRGVVHEALHAVEQGEGLSQGRSGLVVDGHDSATPEERMARLTEDVGKLNSALGSADIIRNTFYLAQTYRDMGAYDAAIDLYARRAKMGGWAEEAWYARYMEGALLLITDKEAGATALLDAYAKRPSRAEPLRALAAHFPGPIATMCTAEADRIPYPENDVLFVERGAYR